MSNTTTPEAINETDYWNASIRIQELLSSGKNPDDFYNRERIDFHGAMSELDEFQRRAQAGGTTGRVILDSLIASGQLIAPEKLDELADIERMLVIGEPALLRQGVDWKLGVLDQDRIFFSNVNRRSHFDELTDGYQALLVRSFIDLRIDSKGTHKFGAKSVEPKDISPGAGNIGMPLVPRDTNTVELSQDMPDGMLAAFRNYSVTLGRPKAHGGRTYLDSLLVGKGVVEKGLGIPLEEVLNFVSNTALQAFITQPASGPAPVETL